MAKHIYRCTTCENYTMRKECAKCSEKTISPKPPKFSLNDKYDKYRREVRKEELVRAGLV